MADNQITDPIPPANLPLDPLPQAPNVGAIMAAAGQARAQQMFPTPKEGVVTGGITPLSSVPNTGRYPVFFRDIDNEEAYAQGQTTWNKFLRSTVQLGGLAAGTFIDGTIGTIAGIFNAIQDGKFSSFYNNPVTNAMDEFNKNLENQYANYYTRRELEANWYEPENLLTANFWLDKVYKNLGFAAGALASGMAWTKTLRALGLFSKIGSVGNAAKAAAATEEAILAAPAAQRMSAIESGLSKIAQDFAKQYSIRNGAQRATQALIMTTGEAAIEALDGMNRFRTELINSYITEHGERPDADAMAEIDSYAAKAGNTRFLLNTALLSATNFIQLPKILGSSYKAEKGLFNDFVQPINRIKRGADGVYESVKPTRLQQAWAARKYFFSGSEAFEEGGQFAIESGVSNYWNKKYRGEDASFIDDMLVKGVGETLTSKEGIESMLIGGLSGAVMTAKRNIQESRKRKIETDKAVEAFNKSYLGTYLKDSVDNYHRGVRLQQERSEAIQRGDFFSAKELEQDFLHSYIAPRVKWGRTDLILEEAQNLRTLISDDTTFNELISEGKLPEGITKEEALGNLNKLISNTKAMAQAYESLNIRYSGQIDENGKRVYSDEVIDKMVYANSKIQDYDRRIPLLTSRLQASNINFFESLDALTKFGAPTKETVDNVLKQIDDLATTDDVKDQLKEDYFDLLEMSQRRQNFVKEYNNMIKNPASAKTEEASPLEVLVSKPKEKIKINTSIGEIEVETGEEYFLGRVVETNEAGNEVYRMPTLTVLGQNEDGTIKIKDSKGVIKDVNQEVFADYKLGKVSAVLGNKTANFFRNHWNDIFEYNFGKDNGGKRRGRLEYDSATNKLFFVYKDAKGRIRRKEIDNTHFVPQGNYKSARIKIVGRLSAKKDINKEKSAAEFTSKEEVQKTQKEKDLKFEQRRNIIQEVIKEAEKRKKNLTDKILAKKEKLAKLDKKLEDAKKFKKFKRLIPSVIAGFRDISRLRFETLNEIQQLEAEVEELDFNLTYYNDLVQNITETNPNFHEFLEDIKSERNALDELILAKLAQVESLKKMVKKSKDLIDTFLKLVKQNKSEKNEELDAAIDRIRKSNDYTLQDEIEITGLLSELTENEAFAENLNRDISIEEKTIEELESQINAIYDEINELSANQEKIVKALDPLYSALKGYLDEYLKKKAEEEAVLANTKLHKQIEASQKEVASQAGDPPAANDIDPTIADESESSKPNIKRIAHTTYNVKEKKAYNEREQKLLTALDSREDRDSFKIVAVTANNEKEFGLEGITEEALAGYKPKAGEEPILFVYVKKEGREWFYVDENGDKLHKIEKNSTAPKSKIAYGMATTSFLGDRYSGNNQQEYQKVWEQTRKEMLANTKFIPYDFSVSRGIPVKGENKSVVSLLPKGTNLSTEGLVTVATTGPIIMPSGESVNVPFGRPFFKFGASLFWANNRKLTKSEKENIKQALKKLTQGLAQKPANWDRLITSYLQGVLYFTPPVDKNGNKTKVSPSQIWFQQGQWVFGANEDKIPFTSESFDNPVYMELLDKFLDQAFIRVNNTKLKDKSKFFEITGFDEKGEVQVKQWNSYQEYLISPEGRNISEIPLTTNVASTENRYSWLPKVTEKVKIVEDKPTNSPVNPAPQQPTINAWGEQVLGGGNISDILSGKKPAQPTETQQPTQPQPQVQAKSKLEQMLEVIKNNTEGTPQGTPATQSEPVEPKQPSQVKPDSSSIEAKKADIERRRKEELNKEFGRNIELVKSGQKAVISRTPDLVKLSSDPQVADSRAQEVIDKYNTINAKYDAELAALEAPKSEETKTQDSNKAEFLAKLAAAKKAREEGKGPAPEVQNKIINNTTYIVGDMQKEKEYIAERLNVPVHVVQNLIKNLQGGFSWGQFRDAAIYLYEKAEVGTGYHEAFEAVWAMFTSLEEKKNILSEFRHREGKFIDRETGKSVKYSEASEYQIKEELAEEFSRYVHQGLTPPKAKRNFIQRFFAALKNFVQNVILGRVTTPEQLFKRIDSGYYKNAPIVNSSNFGQVENKIKGLNQAQSQSVIKGVAAKIFQDLFSESSTSSLIEFEESSVSVDTLFDNVFQRLQEFYEGEQGVINAMLADGRSEDEIYAVYHVWQTVKENWPQTVELTKEYLATYHIVTKTIGNNNHLIDNEDSIEENKESEDSTYDGKADSYLRDVFKLDAKQNAPMSVKLLFATIIDSEFTGSEELDGRKEIIAKRDNATAMEKMVQYARLFNNTLAELNSLNTLEEKFARLEELAEKFPNYTRLINRLKIGTPIDSISLDDWKLRVRMFSTMSKQRPTAYINVIDDEGNSYSIPANQAEASRGIIQGWLDGLKLKSQQPNSFVKFNKSKRRFEFDKDAIKRISVNTKESRIKFLEKLGIIFSDEMLNSLDSKDTVKLHEAIQGLYTGLTKGEGVANSASSLEASGRLMTIAKLFMDSQNYGAESTFYNLEGERVQEFVLPNFFSNIINDINNATDVDDLYRRLPYLQQLWHQGSYYLAPNKFVPKFKIEYIQGTRDVSNQFRPNIPTSKLNEGFRLLQEINQNLRGSFYALIPADSQTEWMVAMANPIAIEGVDNIGWSNFYDIMEKYYNVESQLFNLDGKKRLLAEFGDYSQPMNREALKKAVEDLAREQIKMLMDFNLITSFKSKGETVYKLRGFDTAFLEKKKINKNKVTAQELRELFLFRTMNYMINNIEMHKIFYGDPAAYGKIDNMVKRYKSFLSPRETSIYSSPEVNQALDREYNKVGNFRLREGIPGYQNFKDTMTTVTMSDVMVTGLYDESNSSDAQSWSTQQAYREIRMKAGFRWTKADEIQYQYIQALDRQLMFEDGFLTKENYPKELQKIDEAIVEQGDPKVAVFNPLKPVGSGYTAENNVFLDKTSVVPLSYALTRGKNAAIIYKKMLDEKIDYLIVESGRKVGNTGTDTFYNEDGSINTSPYKNIVEVPFRYYGIQVETTNPKDVQTRGSQLTKEAVINLFENGATKSPEIADKVMRNLDILREMAREGYNRLLDSLGIVDTGEEYVVEDKEKLLTLVRDELLRREVADNIKNALKLDPETNDFVVPLEALNNYQQIKNIIFSYIDKYITSPKMSGGPKIQVSGALWEDAGIRQVKTKNGKKLLVSSGLKFYENEDGKRHIEVLLPSWMNRTLRQAGLKWNTPEELMEKIKQSPDAQEILSGVGFRIPTQELNSVEVFVVKGFLPDYAGDMVVVPEEITTKAGSDFDVDKLNMYLKNVYVDAKGQIRTVKYFKTLEEHDAFYKKEFKAILEARFKDTVEGIEKQGNLQSLFGDLVAGKLKPKAKEKWDGIFREWFGENASAADIEQIFMDRLTKLGKTKAQLTDMEKQEVLLWKFIDEMRKKSLENEYYNSLHELLTLPENFERLTTPNSTKVLTSIRETLVGINKEEFGEGTNKSILNPLYMSRVRHNFIVGKGGVGIAAVAQIGNAVRQLSKVFIDHLAISKIKSPEVRAALGNGRIMLPHNSVVINGISYTSLSSIKDRAGRYISDKISEYINGYVDIAKDAFIVQIGATIDQASTFLLLESAGVPSETVAYFMNQPIIREYLKAWKLRETGEFKNDVLTAVRKKFGVPANTTIPNNFGNLKISELNNKLLRNIKSYYGENRKDIDNAEQQFILNEYLKYQEMANQLFQFTQGINYDTSRFSDSNLVLRKGFQTIKAREESIISSVDEVMNNSFIGEIRRRVVDGTKAVSSIFKFTSPKVMRYIAPTIRNLTNNIYSQADFLKAARKVEVSFIDFLVQTSTGLNNRINELLVNEATSVARQLSNIKDIKGDLKENVILQELVPMVGSQMNREKNVKLLNKAYEVFTSNVYTDALRELRDNPHTQGLYGNLIRLAFLQSGISRSPISFTDIIPVEDYRKVLEPAIAALEKDDLLNAFVQTDAFYRNNWRDDTVVPVQQDRQVGDYEFGDFEYKDRYFSPAISNLVGNDPDYLIFKVHEKGRNFNRKYVKVTIQDPQFSSYQKKEMIKNGDTSFMKTYFLRRVELEDGSPATIKIGKWKYAIFVPSYAWGNGINLQEYYSDIRPSVSDNNTYKPPRELSNIEVINALGINKPDGKTIFDAALTPSQPLIQEKMGTVSEINIYAGTNENADLSNFAIRPFIIGGDEFQSVEQYFQYQKWNYLKDNISEEDFKYSQKIADDIMNTSNGAKLKSLGRMFKGLDSKNWNENASKEMKIALKASFEQNPQALQRLLSTGNAKLTHTQDKGKWGTEFPKLLMEVRDELRKNSSDINPENQIKEDCN